MKKSLVTVKVRSRSNWMMMRQFSMGSWDGKVCIVVGRCVEGKKEALCLLNSLYYNILLLRPLRLSSDSHFRTFTVLGWENGSIFGLLDVRSNVLFFRAIGRKIIHLMLSCFRDVFVLILPSPFRHFISALALFFVHWVVLLCSISLFSRGEINTFLASKFHKSIDYVTRIS